MSADQVVEIRIQNACKSFATVAALQNVDLLLKGGEVHALMGENGAGKSTLIKVLAGVVPADALHLEINGVHTPLSSTNDAKKAGFQFIHQELNIVPHLSVAENISLSTSYPKKFGIFVNWKVLKQRAEKALLRLGVNHINVEQQAAKLNVGDQMLMRIAGSLIDIEGVTDKRLYVFDEPTAAMSDEEADMLFNVIRTLKHTGMAVLYVSHRMNEVMQLADQITVLRDGKLVSSTAISKTSKEDVIFAMTGRKVAQSHPPKAQGANEVPLCIVKNLVTSAIKDVNFKLSKGEILGITGLSNAGQSQVLHALLGLTRIRSGTINFENTPWPTNIVEAWQKQIAYVPKERRREALMLKRSVRDNIALAQIPALSSPTGVMKRASETKRCAELAEVVGLKYKSLDQPVYQLSGGNQQKVVFARAISVAPKLLLLDEPTRGVDVGAKFEIYSLLRKLTASGCGIFLTSTDLPELIGLCDRILIMRHGVQAEIIDAKGLQPASLLKQFYETSSQTKMAS